MTIIIIVIIVVLMLVAALVASDNTTSSNTSVNVDDINSSATTVCCALVQAQPRALTVLPCRAITVLPCRTLVPAECRALVPVQTRALVVVPCRALTVLPCRALVPVITQAEEAQVPVTMLDSVAFYHAVDFMSFPPNEEDVKKTMESFGGEASPQRVAIMTKKLRRKFYSGLLARALALYAKMETHKMVLCTSGKPMGNIGVLLRGNVKFAATEDVFSWKMPDGGRECDKKKYKRSIIDIYSHVDIDNCAEVWQENPAVLGVWMTPAMYYLVKDEIPKGVNVFITE